MTKFTFARASKLSLSIREAMEATGLGRTRIYAEIASGRLRAVKSGRRTLILVSGVEKWLNALPRYPR